MPFAPPLNIISLDSEVHSNSVVRAFVFPYSFSKIILPSPFSINFGEHEPLKERKDDAQEYHSNKSQFIT